jgi:hypothetical protein
MLPRSFCAVWGIRARADRRVIHRLCRLKRSITIASPADMPASITSGLLAYVPCCLWKYRNIYVLGFVVVPFLPETKGKPLPA